jgi:protease I
MAEKAGQLLSPIDALCLAHDSSWTPAPPTAIAAAPSSPLPQSGLTPSIPGRFPIGFLLLIGYSFAIASGDGAVGPRLTIQPFLAMLMGICYVLVMVQPPLGAATVAVLVESQYIPAELQVYQQRFAALGARVELISRLWGQPQLSFVSEVEEAGAVPETLSVSVAIEDFFDQPGRPASRRLADYDALIMAANYTSVRLRYYAPPDDRRSTPAVRLFAEAMAEPRLIKGALCHGLWILTPRPELLAGRRVICHPVVEADVVNAGAVLTASDSGVVVDGDLVTGRSWQEAAGLVEAIAALLRERRNA